MMKKLAALLIALALVCAAHAEEIDLSPTPAPTASPVALPPLSAAPLLESPPFRLDCAAAMLLEADSGQVIFEMNADSPRPVASVTKVMTILLALEAVEAGRAALTDVLTISETAAGMGGSQVLLDVGERQDVATLLKTMIVGSANDAAVALPEALFGSEALCADAMNRRAKELGMAGSHFVNCTGLPAADQHTTARDVAVMARQLFAHEAYFDYSTVWMEDIDHGNGRVTQLVNTNKLLRLYDGCDGGKTGSTNEAGYCVAATAKRGGMRLIAVVLGAASGKERFAIARQMFDYGFANYRQYPVARRGTKVRGRLPVTGGEADGVSLVLDGDLTLLVNKGDEQRVDLAPDLPEALSAPIRAGDAVGRVVVNVDGRAVAEIPIVAAESVEAKGLAFRRIWAHWLARPRVADR